MDKDTEFRELFQFMIEQYQLKPEIAQKLLQKILRILSEYTDESDDSQSNKEREEMDR